MSSLRSLLTRKTAINELQSTPHRTTCTATKSSPAEPHATHGPTACSNPAAGSTLVVRDTDAIFRDSSQIPLERLCTEMSKLPFLERAKVVATECYDTNSVVHHRFVILEIRCPDSSMLWIRIDRLREPGSLAAFLLNLSITPAYDMVRMSKNKDSLIQPGTERENRQEFRLENALSLGDLRQYLLVFVGQLRHYKMYQENCWFFASIIQQFLGASSRGTFVEGRLRHPTWAHRARKPLERSINQLYRIDSPPFSLSEMLRHHNSQYPGVYMSNKLFKALTASVAWDSLLDTSSPDALAPAVQVITTIKGFVGEIMRVDSYAYPDIRRATTALCGLGVMFARQVYSRPWGSQTWQELAEIMSQHGECLSEVSRLSEACEVTSECVTLGARMHNLHGESGVLEAARLADFSKEKAGLFEAAGRVTDACDAYRNAVTFHRGLYTLDPAEHFADCLQRIYDYADALDAAGQYARSLEVMREAVEFADDEAERDSDMCDPDRSFDIDSYTTAVLEAIRAKEDTVLDHPEQARLAEMMGTVGRLSTIAGAVERSCGWFEGMVEVSDKLYEQDSSAYSKLLVKALVWHAEMLEQLTPGDDSCNALEDAVLVSESLFQQDHSEHELYSWALHCYGGALEEHGYFQDALDSFGLEVSILQEWYQRDPRKYVARLMDALKSSAGVLKVAPPQISVEHLRHQRAVIAKRHQYAQPSPAAHPAAIPPNVRHQEGIRNPKNPSARRKPSACERGRERSPEACRGILVNAFERGAAALGEIYNLDASFPNYRRAISTPPGLYTSDGDSLHADITGIEPLNPHPNTFRRAEQFVELYDTIINELVLLRELYEQDVRTNAISLVVLLEGFSAFLWKTGCIYESCKARKEAVDVRAEVYARIPDQYQTFSSSIRELTDTVFIPRRQGFALSDAGACNESRDSVALEKQQYRADPDTYWSSLASALHNYAVALGDCGHFNESCDILADEVRLRRKFRLPNPHQGAEEFVQALLLHAGTLRQLSYIDWSCLQAENDALRICKEEDGDPQDGKDVAWAFQQYGYALRDEYKLEQSCDAFGKAVTILREYREVPEQRIGTIEPLSKALDAYAGALDQSGRTEEASEAQKESKAVLKLLEKGSRKRQ